MSPNRHIVILLHRPSAQASGERVGSFLQSLRKIVELAPWRPRRGKGRAAGPENAEAEPQRSPTAATTRNAARSRRLPFTIGLITMMLSLASGLATYAILTGLTPIVPTHIVVVG